VPQCAEIWGAGRSNEYAVDYSKTCLDSRKTPVDSLEEISTIPFLMLVV